MTAARARGISVSLENEGANAPSEINVIGHTVDDATREVEKFVDRAFLAGLPRVRVVHGSGMGILRKALRQMLQQHPHVRIGRRSLRKTKAAVGRPWWNLTSSAVEKMISPRTFDYLDNLTQAGEARTLVEALDPAIERLLAYENRDRLANDTAPIFANMADAEAVEERRLEAALSQPSEGIDFDQ